MDGNKHEEEGNNISDDYTSDSNRKIDSQHCHCDSFDRTNSEKRKRTPFIYPETSLPKPSIPEEKFEAHHRLPLKFGTDEAQCDSNGVVEKDWNKIVPITKNWFDNYLKDNKYFLNNFLESDDVYPFLNETGVSYEPLKSILCRNTLTYEDIPNKCFTRDSDISSDIDTKTYSQILKEELYPSDTEELDSSKIFKYRKWDSDMICDDNLNNSNCGFIPASQLVEDDSVNENATDSQNNTPNHFSCTPEFQVNNDQQTEFMQQSKPTGKIPQAITSTTLENNYGTESNAYCDDKCMRKHLSPCLRSHELLRKPPVSGKDDITGKFSSLDAFRFFRTTRKTGNKKLPRKRSASEMNDIDSDDEDCYRYHHVIHQPVDLNKTTGNRNNPSEIVSNDYVTTISHPTDHDYGAISIPKVGTIDLTYKDDLLKDRLSNNDRYLPKTLHSEETTRVRTHLSSSSFDRRDENVAGNTVVDQFNDGMEIKQGMVDDYYLQNDMATKFNHSLPSSGFKTAAGKNLLVNETSTKIASKVFEEVDDSCIDFEKFHISDIDSKEQDNKRYVDNNYSRDDRVALHNELTMADLMHGPRISIKNIPFPTISMNNFISNGLSFSDDIFSIAGSSLGFIGASGKEVKRTENCVTDYFNGLPNLVDIDMTEKFDEVTYMSNGAQNDNGDNDGKFEIENNKLLPDPSTGLTTEAGSIDQSNETSEFIVYNSGDLENAMLIAEESSSKRKAASEPALLPDSKRTKNVNSNTNTVLENYQTGKITTQFEDKKKLNLFTSGRSLRKRTYEELIKFGIEEEVLNITSGNAVDYKFPVKRINGKICNGSILIGENVLLNMDRNQKVGLYEIIRSFFGFPYIDSTLITYAWARNHYRWIVWKLASMERSFPDLCTKDCLTVDNVLRQLKYRYKKEVECSQRPILRRIIEKDSSSECRMILCVANIRKVPDTIGEFELELTDGWYSVYTTVDMEMNLLIKKELVKSGTKLITQGAQLLGLTEGCDPLKISNDVKLKISTNSTRRARWYARLGSCSQSFSLKLGLKSILPCGGRVEMLTAFVARIYPVLYMKKVVDKTETYTERAYERLMRIDEENRQMALESAYTEAKKELEREIEEMDRESVDSEERSNFIVDEFNNSKYMKRMTDMLYSVDDHRAMQATLTDEQLAKIEQYAIDKNNEYEEKLKKKIEQKLHSYDLKGKYTRILKVRLVNDEDKMYSATLTIWQPCPLLLSLLVEGKEMIFHNLEASGTKNGELQLTMKKLCFCDTSTHSTIKNNYQRTITTIEQMIKPAGPFLFNEIDIVGIVIHVDEVPKLGNRYSIYLADVKMNIVSVTFRWHVKESGYIDVLKIGNTVAAMNLHYLPTMYDETVYMKNAFVSELSSFTRSSSHKQVNDALHEFNYNLSRMDRDKFLMECRAKLSFVLRKSNIKSKIVVMRDFGKMMDI